MENTCIRVYADSVQIEQCKKDINSKQATFSYLSQILNLAGNEVRLKILFLLSEEGQMCPCDLSDVLNMSVPAISQHLRKLKDAGIVNHKKTGQTVFYSINESRSDVLKPIFRLLTPEQTLS